MSLRAQILIMIAVPLLALVGVGGMTAATDWKHHRDAVATLQQTDDVQRLSRLFTDCRSNAAFRRATCHRVAHCSCRN